MHSPMWEIHPVLCENVTVRGVTIDSHGPNNDGCDPESCKRRADRGLHLRHGRRLHRDQVRPQRRRPARQRAEREHHHPQLHDEGRPRRRVDRQRDLRRLPQRLRRGLPDGQPEPRPRAAPQEQRACAAACSRTSTCATSPSARWPTPCSRSTSLRGGREGRVPPDRAQHPARARHQHGEPARDVHPRLRGRDRSTTSASPTPHSTGYHKRRLSIMPGSISFDHVTITPAGGEAVSIPFLPPSNPVPRYPSMNKLNEINERSAATAGRSAPSSSSRRRSTTSTGTCLAC